MFQKSYLYKLIHLSFFLCSVPSPRPLKSNLNSPSSLSWKLTFSSGSFQAIQSSSVCHSLETLAGFIVQFILIHKYSISFFFFFLIGSTVDLKCCVSFNCTAKWFSYKHIYIIFFQILFPYRLLKNTEYTVGPCWLSVLHIVVCIR